ncbi:MAG: transposase [Bryobacterales bacterium]|nr:transposase [Bryobacterales bacterium]
MARIRRVVAVGCPHHVTQRGNFRRNIFYEDEDRSTYLALLADSASAAKLQILGFCLMTNHVHRIAVPERSDSLGPCNPGGAPQLLALAQHPFAPAWPRVAKPLLLLPAGRRARRLRHALCGV